MTADVVLLAGRVRTMDARRPLAQGVAWRTGRLVAVGTRDEVLAWSGPRTRVIDAPDACVLPGFHDAHLHLTQHGLELEQVGLADAATLDEGLARVAAAATRIPEGSWILGAGFALQRWGLRGLDRRDLDRVAPRHPVMLRSQDHHSAWANAAALALAGIGAATADPDGGVIVREADGEPSGLLLEAALELVWDVVPRPDAAALGRALDAAGRDLAAHGITTVHHMAYEPPSHWRALASRASRADGGAYPLRVWACIPHADLERAAAIGLAGGQGGDHFVVGGAKFFADGALGSRTAWMLQPYGEGGVGMVEDGPDVLPERFTLAAEAGFAPVTHAIGDAANRAVIAALEATAPAWRAAGLRPRIEHAQHLHADDVARLAALGAVASMQPIHLTFDAASVRALLPDRLDRAYRTRDLLAAGVPLAFGSDTPVAPPDVLAGLRAAVGRQGADGLELGAGQALSVPEALAAYTTGAAFAIGREGRSGMLREGYDADVVLLDHDPLAGLDDLTVVATAMDGAFTHGGDGLGG
ncbi:MAG: amidohydrolase [Trueperaceae bacterium]